jgi:hypothetical protein
MLYPCFDMRGLASMTHHIEIVPYDARWPQEFRSIAAHDLNGCLSGGHPPGCYANVHISSGRWPMSLWRSSSGPRRARMVISVSPQCWMFDSRSVTARRHLHGRIRLKLVHHI